jgi:hypothetical protein
MTDAPKSKLVWWHGLIASIFVLYGLSGWPIGFLIGVCSESEWRLPLAALRIIQKPHFFLAYHNETYYNYITHAVMVGAGSETVTSWEAYRYYKDNY